MNPKHHEFLALDRIAELRREAAGGRRMARVAIDAQVATSAVGRRGWPSRLLRPRFPKLGRLIARLVDV
ncbi:MAG: hypothetical protein M3067_11635 [Chloroflexota bacterium]|nr:hypothetical protein [Chloroflexota bacterium]